MDTVELNVDGDGTGNCFFPRQNKSFCSTKNSTVICGLLITVAVFLSSLLLVTLHIINHKTDTSLEQVELLLNESFAERDTPRDSLSPLIIVTEGGCSGSTAVGQYLRHLVLAHDLDFMKDVHFEFLHKNKNPRTNKWKNPFYHNISVQAQASKLNLTDDEMMIKSVNRATKIARKQKKVMIFKATFKQYEYFHEHFKHLHPTYFGVYRQDALRRCICMIKDCFHGVIDDGYPVFAENGTRTDLCFNRRFQHEVPIQIMLKNVRHCLDITTEAHSFLKTQSFPSLPEEELFLFEYSKSDNDLTTSSKGWARILDSTLKALGVTLNEATIRKALEPFQNSRPLPPKSYKTEIRNYDEIEESLLELGVLDP